MRLPHPECRRVPQGCGAGGAARPPPTRAAGPGPGPVRFPRCAVGLAPSRTPGPETAARPRSRPLRPPSSRIPRPAAAPRRRGGLRSSPAGPRMLKGGKAARAPVPCAPQAPAALSSCAPNYALLQVACTMSLFSGFFLRAQGLPSISRGPHPLALCTPACARISVLTFAPIKMRQNQPPQMQLLHKRGTCT